MSHARQYLANRSLWFDEALLALNILDRDWSRLAEPLDYNQGAPLLFLWLEKGAVLIFGPQELSLRLVPFVAGLLALLLCWPLARHYLSRPATAMMLFMVAISGPLIYYAAEVKQYSSDVLVGLICLAMFRHLRSREIRVVLSLSYGLLGAVLVWLSHPAIFCLAGVGLLLVYHPYRRRTYGQLALVGLMVGIWAGSFLAFYWLSLQSLTANETLQTYWGVAFGPSLRRPFIFLRWLIQKLLNLFRYPLDLSMIGLGIFFAVLGGIALFRRDRPGLLSLVLPLGLVLLAAIMGRYPFSGRMLLFLVPPLLILIAAGVEQAANALRQAQLKPAIPLLIGLLLFHPVLKAVDYLAGPKLQEEIRPAIAYIYANRAAEDTLYLYYASQRPYQYYQQAYGFPDMAIIKGIKSRRDWFNYLADMDKIRRQSGRVWLLFSHVHVDSGVNEEQLMINYLHQLGGQQLDQLQLTDASVYLYQFPD